MSILVTQPPSTWDLDSWRTKPCAQSISYQDPAALEQVLNLIRQQEPLVTSEQIQRLHYSLQQCSLGRKFLLHAGDCAETFADCQPHLIEQKWRLLQTLQALLEQNLQKPVVVLGRMAGQYAKPRTDEYECRDNQVLLSYRGDMINGKNYEAREREPNPQRLWQSYQYAQQTIDVLRSFDDDFFCSHEALHLEYEQALTHRQSGQWYDLSAHLLWLGMRTNQSNGAHVEFLRGVCNPIALKIGPNATASWLKEMLQILNPTAMPGRLTLVTRLGVKHVARVLPTLIEVVLATHTPVLWCCDPMHGNTHMLACGQKFRLTADLEAELNVTGAIHRQYGSELSGIHLEVTPESVIECVNNLGDVMPDRYQSALDPRMNSSQAQQFMIKIATALQTKNKERYEYR